MRVFKRVKAVPSRNTLRWSAYIESAMARGGGTGMDMTFLLAVVLGAAAVLVAGAAAFITRSRRAERRGRRRRRAARHAANVLLWNQLFRRSAHLRLTDQRAVAPKRSKNL